MIPREKQLQRALHALLSDPARIWRAESGARLQILSPGRLNPAEGPDFRDVAILLGGAIYCGDAEFHLRASDWARHGHSGDPRYDNVILHIALVADYPECEVSETLVVDERELAAVPEEAPPPPDIHSVEDLQDYALVRLLRKTAEARRALNRAPLKEALYELAEEYMLRYNSKRKRPVYNENQLEALALALKDSEIARFLERLENGTLAAEVCDCMFALMKRQILGEGAHFRRELVLNAALPLALCLASEEQRISLFLWYWSTSALCQYGLLSRRFPAIPQNYLWQQQGMLEYLREHGAKPNIVAEACREYALAEALSFYRLGRPPARRALEEERP
ncbi:MAG: DUF2851 family protein [Chloroflexota bacterium]